jgi:hypothetical protein
MHTLIFTYSYTQTNTIHTDTADNNTGLEADTSTERFKLFRNLKGQLTDRQRVHTQQRSSISR